MTKMMKKNCLLVVALQLLLALCLASQWCIHAQEQEAVTAQQQSAIIRSCAG